MTTPTSRFSDCLGRTWELRITLADVPRLREVGLDLNKATKDPTHLGEIEDLEVWGRVLWLLCERQAQTMKIEPEDFGRGLDGPSFSDAMDSFIVAFQSFSLRPTVARAAATKYATEAERRDQTTVTRILSGSNDSAGSLPASSASIPPG